MVTFGCFCLNLSSIPAMAFLNASALDPEFQAITLIVTGPLAAPAAGWAAAAAAGAAVAAGWAAGAAGFGASAGFDSAGLAGALVAAGVDCDWPHAANTAAPAPSASVPSKRRRLTCMRILPHLSRDARCESDDHRAGCRARPAACGH